MKSIIRKIGLSAPLVYIFTVILGGALWPGYSHIRQPISELSMAGAPNLALMDILFLIYNVLLLVFSVGFTIIYKKEGNKPLTASGVFLTICALTGIAFAFFRQDPIGAPATLSGTIHLILAGVASLSTIFTIFFGAAGFGRNQAVHRLKPFSILMGFVVLVTGGLTAAGMQLFPQIFGILERTTIGAFMLWLLVINWQFLKTPIQK